MILGYEGQALVDLGTFIGVACLVVMVSFLR